jgi:hypothetical protein
MGYHRIEVLGKKFGKLTVVANSDRKHGSAPMYLCECECGNTTYRTATQLRATAFPRCINCLHKTNRGRTRSKPGETGFNSLYSSYRGAARNRGFIFDLTKEIFRELTQQSCHYCGASPSKCQYGSYGFTKDYGSYVYNGIDRVDSTKGYTLENSVPCCHMCNMMKHKLHKEEFLEQCRKITEYLGSK